MALNGWQRIGIVATGLWIVAIVATACLERWGNPASVFSSEYSFQFVEFNPSPEQPLKKADPDTGQLRGATLVIPSLSLYLILRAAFVPLLFGWLLSYIMLWTIQWVKKGFRSGKI